MAFETNQTEKENKARSMLEEYVKEWKIFIDTCSILHIDINKFWMNIYPLLEKYNKKIIVPLRVIEELEKHKENISNANLSKRAKEALISLEYLRKKDLLEIRGETNDNFSDNVFQVVFTKFRMNYKLLLITQDNDLSKDIDSLNNNKSVKANPVNVKRINQYGFLSDYSWNTKNNKFIPKVNIDEEIDEEEIFQISKEVTKIEDSKQSISYIPKENESVYAVDGTAISLIDKVAAGGEGIIYTTNTPYVAKIYKKENNTRRKYEKIKLMLSKRIKCQGICYPLAALYNNKKEFIGYLMPEARGKELRKSLFIKKLLEKNFPTWRKRDTVELCITILQKIKYLHDRNIIMGDINPANILVVSPKEVYFVDTDSYQIEDFPCPVGTINYTAPEIQRKHFSGFLRTKGNENFAVATLLFMIMLPGKPPYSQQGGEDPISNIIKMDFSYPFGDNSNKKTPDGPWRYIWSHLTYDLKKAFYNTFRIDGENSKKDDRLSVNEWLSIFKYYLELLDSGKYGKQDEMSEELFPTRHKKNPKIEYVICKLCKNEVAEDQCKNGICRECLKKGEVHTCKKCGKEILYTNYEKYIKNSKRFEVCQDCFNHGNEVRIYQTCVDCGKKFEITNNQYDFYVNKNLSIPKRCKSCIQSKNEYSSSNKKSSSSDGSWCFISTVVCEYFGKDDNCNELNTLRNYRDNWLRLQPDGEELIKEYYNIAPIIVERLKSSKNYSEYCEILWDNYLQPCLSFIDKKEYELCKKHYIEMFNYLYFELIEKVI